MITKTLQVFALTALCTMLSSAAAIAQSVATLKQITQVENNLMPFVPVKGFKGWNIEDRMRHYKVPGLSIAVIHNYKIAWTKAYGLADTLKKTPVTTNTLFSAGSVSKLVMAVAALKMVEQQQLRLDAPINDYLRSWKIKENEFTAKTPVTLRMLLSHSAGTSQASYFGFTPGEPLPGITDVLKGEKIAGTRQVVVNSEPGKGFRYSGGGSMIAQMALMDVAGKSFDTLMQELVFLPLQMHHSTFAQPLPARFARQSAWAYSYASWFKGMPYVYPQQAAAGLHTTPTDLAKLINDIQQSYLGKGEVLSKTTTKIMLSPQHEVSNGAYKEEIAVGPFLLQRSDNTASNGVYFEFTGVNAGFLAYAIGSVEGGNGVVIMLNSGDDVNGLGKEIRRSVAKIYNWVKFLPEEIVPVTLADKELEALTGRYRMGPNEVLYLRKEKNYLVENINDGNDIYCFPVARDTIIFSDFNVKGFFVRNEKGAVTGLQNVYQQKPMPKMGSDEFSPAELLKMEQYEAAKKAFAALQLNEYQISYLAYELINKKPMQAEAAKTILEVAMQQHPKSAIVHSRMGDYYLNLNQRPEALFYYKKALELDPADEQLKINLIRLQSEK